MNKLLYKLQSGKNSKYSYYLKHFLCYLIPQTFYLHKLDRTLQKVSQRTDYNYIKERVNYYNKLNSINYLPKTALPLYEHRYKKVAPKEGSVYFFDSYEYTRWFSQSFKWSYRFGDITYNPELPSIVKSRPIAGNNANSVIMKLNKIRHFIFVNDTIPFEDKQNKIIFRGKSKKKEKRIRFMEKYFQHPLCDLGDIGRYNDGLPTAWKTPKMTIKEHLKYKFIMALEGNDVASNLKWIMSSNSIAVMPEPEFETWFMEGTLIPDYHYIRIKADYSDLEERINYYIEHPEKAQEIINHAHEYVEQFKNKKREKLISLLTLQKYFTQTGQLTKPK